MAHPLNDLINRAEKHTAVPLSQIVGSPEEAAILVYQDQPPDFIAEPDQKAYRLYEVDFDKTTINQINIPKVSFAPCEPSP